MIRLRYNNSAVFEICFDKSDCVLWEKFWFAGKLELTPFLYSIIRLAGNRELLQLLIHAH